MNKKNACKIGIVILHYKTIDETICCVESINKVFGTENTYIAIVDNSSNNGSGEKLSQMYSSRDICIISLKENVGFARGLNAGIEYLRKNYPLDFILLVNNDIEFYDADWRSILMKKYSETGFAVMGPDVVTLEGFHCNPAVLQFSSLDDVQRIIRSKKLQLFFEYSYIASIKFYIKQFIKKAVIKTVSKNTDYLNERTNVQLQGSCLILSNRFFEKYNGLFDQTFLYFEEAILKYMCDIEGLVTLYSPDLRILHKEGVSTNMKNQNRRKKRIFYLTHSLHSCEVFYNWAKKREKTDE